MMCPRAVPSGVHTVLSGACARLDSARFHSLLVHGKSLLDIRLTYHMCREKCAEALKSVLLSSSFSCLWCVTRLIAPTQWCAA